MNDEQQKSIARSLLKIAGGVLVARGMSQYATLLNTEDVLGLVAGAIGFIWSHYTHADTQNSTKQ